MKYSLILNEKGIFAPLNQCRRGSRPHFPHGTGTPVDDVDDDDDHDHDDGDDDHGSDDDNNMVLLITHIFSVL